MFSLVLYLSSFAISSWMSNTCQSNRKVKFSKLLIVVLCPLVLASLRYGIGTDYANYDMIFYSVSENTYDYGVEPLFKLLIKIVGGLHGTYQILLVICALITYTVTLFAMTRLYKLYKDVTLPIAMWVYYCYFYSATYNLVRQMIAVSIVLLAITYLLEKRNVIFIFLVVFASGFHITAMVAFGFLLIVNINKTSKGLYKICYIALLAFLLIFGVRLGTMFGSWIGAGDAYVREESAWLFVLKKIPIVTFNLLPLILSKIFKISNSRYAIVEKIALLIVPFTVLEMYFSYIGRLLFYFNVTQMILVANFLCSIKNRHKKFGWTIVFIVLYGLYFIYSSYIMKNNEIFPYAIIEF